MNKKLALNYWTIPIIGLLVLVLVLGAYSVGARGFKLPGALPPAGDPGSMPTKTQQDRGSETAAPDPVAATSSPEILASDTSTPDATATVLPTATIAPPTATSTAVAIPLPDDWAKLTSSNPVDGAYFPPSATFTKIWTVKNVGTTTWTKDFDLIFISGTSMAKKLVYPLASKVLPGQSIKISLVQTAPAKPGTYQGFWMLSNSAGETFGIGEKADQALKNKITVLNVDPANNYDLLLEYCQAAWWNSNGEAIKCPGEPGQNTGFVLLSSQPTLENGSSDRPVLWVHTNNVLEGIISGKYPAYLVQEGDHFRAKVGCLSGYPKCNVTFKLLYKIGSSPNQSLGSWKEVYGGGVTTINIDLTPLAGQDVQFILRMISTNNYPDSAHGFWMTPRIIYMKPTPTPTASVTPSPTPTPTETIMPSETPTDTPIP